MNPVSEKVIATISCADEMPVDAFVIFTGAFVNAPLAAGGTIPERQLLVRNSAGGYTVYVNDAVPVRAVFDRGHFEVRWVPT